MPSTIIVRPLNQQPDRRARHHGQRHGREEADAQALTEEEGEVAARHGHRAVREVSNAKNAEDHRQAQRDDDVHRANGHAIEHLLQDLADHRLALAGVDFGFRRALLTACYLRRLRKNSEYSAGSDGRSDT
jgi:hypothetical protein